jgi:hypothetical protein
MRPIRTLLLLLPLAALPTYAQDSRPAPAAGRTAPPVAKPVTAPALTLQQVRSSFAKVDADRSGSLDSKEALAGGLDAAEFLAADADGDQRLSQDEFIVGREGKAAKQAGSVATDLTAESTRLQALRRAQKAEELKTRRDATPTRPAAPDAPTANGPGAARSAAGNPRAAQPAAKSDGPVAAPGRDPAGRTAEKKQGHSRKDESHGRIRLQRGEVRQHACQRRQGKDPARQGYRTHQGAEGACGLRHPSDSAR